MNGSFVEVNGIRGYQLAVQGSELRTGNDAVDVMSAASEERAAFIVIPAERLGEDFFDLRTGIAGEIVQKFVMYGARVVIVGDISRRVAESKSLAAFVAEANCGRNLWFVPSSEQLGILLGTLRP